MKKIFIYLFLAVLAQANDCVQGTLQLVAQRRGFSAMTYDQIMKEIPPNRETGTSVNKLMLIWDKVAPGRKLETIFDHSMLPISENDEFGKFFAEKLKTELTPVLARAPQNPDVVLQEKRDYIWLGFVKGDCHCAIFRMEKNNLEKNRYFLLNHWKDKSGVDQDTIELSEKDFILNTIIVLNLID